MNKFNSIRCLQQARSILSIQKRFCYYVLLPEEPLGTEAENAFLKAAKGGEFEFNNFTQAKCTNGIARLCMDQETAIFETEEKIRGDPKSVTFENSFGPLEKLKSCLLDGWNLSQLLFYVRPDILPSTVFRSCHDRAFRASCLQFLNPALFDACKTLLDGPSSDLEKRVLNKFFIEGKLNGLDLDAEKAEALNSMLKSKDFFQTTYQANAISATEAFRHELSKGDAEALPESLRRLLTPQGCNPDEGPWIVTLEPETVEQFLLYCGRSSVRWNVWQAFNSRATTRKKDDNSLFLERKRKYSIGAAQVLGYSHYVDMKMQTQMAGNTENAFSMISTLSNIAIPRLQQEYELLNEFARSQGFVGYKSNDLAVYDVPFYKTLQRNHLYGNEDISAFLPLEHVLAVLFQLISQLFGVVIEEIESKPNSVWHKDVRTFALCNNDGAQLALFYLDLYERPGEKMNFVGNNNSFDLTVRCKSSSCSRPEAALIFNFRRPEHPEQPTLLQLSDVVTLFSKFGGILQNLMSTVPHCEVSGSTNLEWDAAALCKHFMANWVYVPAVLAQLTSHYETGDQIPAEQVYNIVAASNHMASHSLCHHLYLANLDLSLFASSDHWHSIMTRLWEEYFPYRLEDTDSHPCSLDIYVNDVWTGAYYSLTWARVLAADCTQAFMEKEDWETVGSRFRSTFLETGGGAPQASLFRMFRGRDPCFTALTDLYGIH